MCDEELLIWTLEEDLLSFFSPSTLGSYNWHIILCKFKVCKHWFDIFIKFKVVTILVLAAGGSQVALVVKNTPAGAADVRDVGSIPELGKSPWEGKAIDTNILAWRILWIEDCGSLQLKGLQRIGHDWSGHVWMWELDYKESWTQKILCFWTVVLEKTLESPLDCKEIQPVHPKGDQFWVFMTDVEAETPILWPPHAKSWLIGKDPDAGRDWGQEEKGTTEDEMARWHHWLDGHEFE